MDKKAEAILAAYLEGLESCERDALFRFYIHGQNATEIEDATGLNSHELRLLKSKAKAHLAAKMHWR